MQADVQTKLAASLTAEDVKLIPYLPYLLQDLWELGGLASTFTKLVQKHIPAYQDKHFLDLACGKGAVCIELASKLGVHVTGVDLMPEFIAYARQKAQEHHVKHLCNFAVTDVNVAVQEQKGFDCVIFSASGDILGPPEQMLDKLKAVSKPGGFIMLDESYLKEGSGHSVSYQNYEYLSYGCWKELFTQNGLQELERWQLDNDELLAITDRDYKQIEQRAHELTAQYPDQQELFAGYLRSQQNEADDMQLALENVLWLLKIK